MHDYEARFVGIRRLVGAAGQDRLRQAHVCVVGLGGVGSWAVEALARCGLGALTLVDMDQVCVSNVNRQLHATTGQFGKPKSEVMALRVREIHPDCAVREINMVFNNSTADEILTGRFDFVLDAIDSPSRKALLIAGCHRRGTPVISAGAAGGRRDPGAIRVEDLARTTHDRLLLQVRRVLRSRHGFPRGRKAFGVPVVYSPEQPTHPAGEGSVSARPDTNADANASSDCRHGYGTVPFVTGAFGLTAAGLIVSRILAGEPSQGSQ